MKLYREADELPLCYTQDGCPIEDLVTDDELQRDVSSFLLAKSLYNATEDPETQRRTFREIGLYDDPETHLEMEVIYSQWMKAELQRRSQK